METFVSRETKSREIVWEIVAPLANHWLPRVIDCPLHLYVLQNVFGEWLGVTYLFYYFTRIVDVGKVPRQGYDIIWRMDPQDPN